MLAVVLEDCRPPERALFAVLVSKFAFEFLDFDPWLLFREFFFGAAKPDRLLKEFLPLCVLFLQISIYFRRERANSVLQLLVALLKLHARAGRLTILTAFWICRSFICFSEVALRL